MAFAVVAGASSMVLPAPTAPAAGSAPIHLHPLATYDPISSDGVSPSAISLSWAPTGDTCFQQYLIERSTLGPSGPWTTVTSIVDPTLTTTFVAGLVPKSTYWWQVVDVDCVGQQTSNALGVTQPSVAFLGFVQPSPSSVQLTWTNGAQYGGLLSFSAYQVSESINRGPASVIVTIPRASTMNWLVTSLSAGATYSFFVTTIDECNNCPTATLSASVSNPVNFAVASGNPGGSGGSSGGWVYDSSLLLLVLGIALILGVIGLVAALVILRRHDSSRHLGWNGDQAPPSVPTPAEPRPPP